MSSAQKTFYLETFGCQMNVHDSEKVVGTLISQGYRPGGTRGSRRPDPLQHLLHPRQGRAEGLPPPERFQAAAQARASGSACWAAWRSRKARRFSSARRMSRWCAGRPPTATCRRCWCRLEAGAERVTGLDDRQTDETFETEFTARYNPHRGYITIIEGCDKFCAYCVVPYTRGKERSRKSDSVLAEARRMADAGFTEIQLLGQNVNSYRDPLGQEELCRIAGGRGRSCRASGACASRPRIRATLPATSSRPSMRCPRCAITCICRCRAARRACSQSMPREYTREQYLERIAWIKATRRARSA